jgi:hypothetical protein
MSIETPMQDIVADPTPDVSMREPLPLPLFGLQVDLMDFIQELAPSIRSAATGRSSFSTARPFRALIGSHLFGRGKGRLTWALDHRKAVRSLAHTGAVFIDAR